MLGFERGHMYYLSLAEAARAGACECTSVLQVEVTAAAGVLETSFL